MRKHYRKALIPSAVFAVLIGCNANALPLLGWSAQTYPAIGSNVGIDWSSDFGVDYSATPFGGVVGNGSVSGGSWLAPGESFVAPNSTYTATVSRPGFLGGDVSGTIAAEIGSYGAIGPSVVHHYRLDFELNNPSYCCGVGTHGVVEGRFDFDKGTLNASTAVPQYWVAEFIVDVVNPGSGYYLNYDARFGPWSLLSSLTPATGRYTGSFSGSGSLPWYDSFCFGSLDTCSRSYWTFTAGGGIDGGGTFELASLGIDIAIAFSDLPFDRIVYSDVTPDPGPGPVGVEEPQLLALLGAGLFGLAMLRRRQRRANDNNLSYNF